MESFVIAMKNDRVRGFNRLGLSIVLLNAVYSVYFFLNIIRTGNSVALAAGAVFAFTGLLINFNSAFKNKDPRVPFAVLFSLFAIQWACLYHYWLSLVFVALAFFDVIARRKQDVNFFVDGIEFPSFPKRTIAWGELNNVILKDHILTIDFKNDKLVQGEIAVESHTIDEGGFNDFCRQQLKTGNG
jgi:hypothetical protein